MNNDTEVNSVPRQQHKPIKSICTLVSNTQPLAPLSAKSAKTLVRLKKNTHRILSKTNPVMLEKSCVLLCLLMYADFAAILVIPKVTAMCLLSGRLKKRSESHIAIVNRSCPFLSNDNVKMFDKSLDNFYSE